MGVSGGAGRRAGAIHRHSADKYGTPQKRAVQAWKQWLMNKQHDPRILLINKMIPLGAERDGRGIRRAEKSLLYANNMQQHMTINAPMAQLDWTQSATSPVTSLLNSFSLQKQQLIATNWGLISSPDCCTHLKRRWSEASRGYDVDVKAPKWISMMMTSIYSFLWFQFPIHTTCIQAKVFQHVDKNENCFPK